MIHRFSAKNDGLARNYGNDGILNENGF